MKDQSETIPALPDFLEVRRQNLTFDLAFATWQGPFDVWQRECLKLWRSTLPPTDPAPELIKKSGDRITLKFATGAETSGCLKRPPNTPAPYPAILLLHDHGGYFELGWEKLFANPKSRDYQKTFYGGRSPAEVFLEQGFAVMCVDALGWGSRYQGGYSQQQALAANAMGLGWSLAGLVASEDIQAAQWLACQPDIDANRIGAFGFSFGALRAWQLAALSPLIKTAASLSWMAERQALMAPDAPLLRGQSAYYFLHPFISNRLDFPDMAGLAAKKPLFFRSGEGDRHMPVDSVTSAWNKITGICTEANGPVPDVRLHDKAHTCPEECLHEAASFFKTHLI